MTVNETVTTSTQGAAKATVSKSDRVARILQNCYELRSSHYADKVKAEELLASSWEEHHADYALTPAIIEDLLRARRCCQAIELVCTIAQEFDELADRSTGFNLKALDTGDALLQAWDEYLAISAFGTEPR